MQNICILRLSAIGDTTHVLPVIASIRQRYPQARLTWIIGSMEYRLMQGLPGVEFIVFSKKAGLRGLWQLRRQLRKRRFDVLLHMQLSLRANMLAALVPAKRKIGYDRERSKELHSLVINERIEAQPRQHVLDGFMQFARAIGVTKPVYQWPFHLDDADHALAREHITQHPTVIISHSSSHQLRNWLPEHYAAVADHLIEHYRAQVLLCGGPAEQEQRMADEIRRHARHRIIDLTGQDTLKQLLAMLQAADLVISPDSGPLHMAGAVGTPVIGLHAASNFRRSGSYQFPQLAVDAYAQACEKLYGQPPDSLRWGIKAEQEGVMALITPQQVYQAIERWYRTLYSKKESMKQSET